MTPVTRRIGLSLGADLCWPICFEEILRRLDLTLPIGGEDVRFEVERVTIEPFDLRQPCRYDVVLDRLTHWYSMSREWIKKAVLMDGLYVFNNPWAIALDPRGNLYVADALNHRLQKLVRTKETVLDLELRNSGKTDSKGSLRLSSFPNNFTPGS